MNQTVDVEQSRSSSGSIDKDENYKINKNIGKYQFSQKRKICHVNDLTPLIAQQTIIVANIVLPTNIHNPTNQFDHDRNSNNTTMTNKLLNNSNRTSKKSTLLLLKTTSRRSKCIKVAAFDNNASKKEIKTEKILMII